jgi:hypothetical protein
MEQTNQTTIRNCDSHDGDDCLGAVVIKACTALFNMASGLGEAEKAELLRIADSLGQAVKTGGGERLRAVSAGSRFSVHPFYDKETRHLSLGGEPAVVFLKKRCRQAELLEAFQSRDWPPSIDQPLGPPSATDPEKGLRDLVFHLNKKQEDLPRRVHFWCDDRTVHWEIAGDEPANR